MKNMLLLFAIISVLFPLWSQSETVIHIDSKRGSDGADGSQSQPFKTIAQAALAIPESASGPVTLVIHPGRYALAEKVTLNRGQFSQQAPLTIQASILPDNPNWQPDHMPVIESTKHPGIVEGRGKPISGFSIEISHVKFQGLRFKGNPAVGHRYYPIRRDNPTLENLHVTQCLFEGDQAKAPIHVAVIARGHGIVVEHSIFKECRNPTVFWKAEGGNSYGNAFRHCIATNSYQSGLWTTDTASDFDFRNNIFLGGEVFHIHLFSRESFYSFSNSYIVGFKVPQRLTNGPGGKEAPNPAPITIREHRIFRQADIQLNLDEAQGKNRRWLHVQADSPGAELNAGLFTKF